jgi:hypothetical protein
LPANDSTLGFTYPVAAYDHDPPAGDARVDLRFGIDRAGELYILSKANGKIWKVTGVMGSAP